MVIYNVSYNVNRFKSNTINEKNSRNVFGTTKISFNLEFYTLSNRHFRRARSQKSFAHFLFPREICSSKTMEYNKTEGNTRIQDKGGPTQESGYVRSQMTSKRCARKTGIE